MASYREAITWIAYNDADGDSDRLDVEAVSQILTVCLVADIFKKDQETVAKAVVARRKRMDREEGGGHVSR